MVIMNEETLVQVEYRHPQRQGMIRQAGWLRKGGHHLLLVSEKIEGVDLYSYTIIPKEFVERIIGLK